MSGLIGGVGRMVMAGSSGVAEAVSRQWVTAGVARRGYTGFSILLF